MAMNEELLSGLPTGGLDLFVPDPALSALYALAQAAAREHGWECPSREEFEARYKAEIATSRKSHE